MNKYIFHSLIASAIIILSSCEPNMDDTNPNSMTTSSYYKTKEQLEVGVNAAYSLLQSGGLYGRYAYYTFNEHGDDWDKTYKAAGIPEIAITSNFATTGAGLDVQWHWKGFYHGIYACNLVLENLYEAPSTVPKDAVDRMIGESLFLRAFYNFLLVSNFGEEVPYIDATPKTTEEFWHGNSPKGYIYTKIIEDLSKAINLLPTRTQMMGKWGTNNRATKGAAQALLAKVYIYRPILDWGKPAEFDKAKEMLKSVIESKEYKLASNFRMNFMDTIGVGKVVENNEESLFEVQFKNDQGGFWLENLGDRDESTWREQEIGMYDGVGASWWNLTPTQKAIDEFEPGDPRLYMSIRCPGGANYTDINGTILKYEDYGGSVAHYSCRKYCQDYGTAEWESGINDRLIRFADVLLMYAECIVETGGTADDAAPWIDSVRMRANNVVPTEQPQLWYSQSPGWIPTVKGLLAKDTTINGVRINSITRAIRHERFVEMFGEYQRYYDLLRWSMGTNDPIDLSATLNNPIDKGYSKGKEFLPYPDIELANNPKLKQPVSGN